MGDPHIGSLRIIRCMVQPTVREGSAAHWTIVGSPFDEEPQLSLFGELLVHDEDSVVAVTSSAMIGYEAGKVPFEIDDPDSVLVEIKRIGTILTHVLWDAAADFARQLVAATRLELEVPLLTPDVEFEVAVFDDDEEDESDASASAEAQSLEVEHPGAGHSS